MARPFLATTALWRYWDISSEVVFLGEWCKRYTHKEEWLSFSEMQVSSNWETFKSVEAAQEYLNNLYEFMLVKIAKALNAVHKMDKDSEYWRIIIGPWLWLYLPVVYERFLSLKRAQKEYPNFWTIGMNPDDFVVPQTSADFDQWSKTDEYNLQLYTKLLTLLKHDIEYREVDFPLKQENVKKYRIKQQAKRSVKFVVEVFTTIIQKSVGEIYLYDSYFPRRFEMALFYLTRGQVQPILKKEWKGKKLTRGNDKRDAIKEQLGLKAGCDQFESFLPNLLAEDLPICFVESFAELREFVKRNFPERAKGIFSANAWYYDEAFKVWAAESKEQGTLLLGMQHGGTYGSLSIMQYEEHELKITDRYYSWGWEREKEKENGVSIVVPFYASKLVLRQSKVKSSPKILMAATTMPRYQNVLLPPYINEWFLEYLLDQASFLDALSEDAQRMLSLRLHRTDNGWDMKERIQDQFPYLQIEDWNVPFLQSLQESKLFVCDHFSTTFYEALSNNHPTIVFGNPEQMLLCNDAKPYYQSLKDVGILFESPVAAAEQVNQIINDVEAWWNEPLRQSARKKFCDRYARTADNSIQLWHDELNRVLAGAKVQKRGLHDQSTID